MIQCPGSILSREIAIMKKKLPSNSCLETMAIGSAFKASGSIMPTNINGKGTYSLIRYEMSNCLFEAAFENILEQCKWVPCSILVSLY